MAQSTPIASRFPQGRDLIYPSLAESRERHRAKEKRCRDGAMPSAGWISYWLGAMVRLLLALVCVAPSAWVNGKAQLDMGAGYHILSGVLLFAFLAPIFTMCTAHYIDMRRYLAASFWGVMATIFIVMNFLISLGGISAVRDLAMDANAQKQRIAAQNDRAYREASEKIASLRKVAGNDVPDMIAGRIATLKRDRLYARSEQCQVVTKGDSEMLCKSIEEENVRLAAAREIVRLEALIEQKGWAASTSTEMPVPASVDPQIENMIALLAAFTSLKPDHRLMAALLSGAFALLLELAADIGPIACWVLLRRNDDTAMTPAATPMIFGEALRGGGAGREESGRIADPVREGAPFLPAQESASIEAIPVPNPAPGIRPIPTQDSPMSDLAGSQILANSTPQERAAPEPEILHQDPPQERSPIPAGNKSVILVPGGLNEASLRDVQFWRDNCADADREGQRVLYGDAFDHYSKWCGARGKKPVIKPAFGLAMKELGWPVVDHKKAVEQGVANYRAKVAGQFYLYGIVLRRHGALKVVKS